ncbi:hypothetical protein GCM10018793_57690 [Streptomyces sulfonofaciens]|uniref:Uncharacterized protein n=1 Tax=Streptomyces sulfonofaciens TaxID=68272 RepID=A0A919GLQ1_9ACTN|nr:hypothetical protein GCM10018793_57690 [Streptomyces sulfonofaciens]
MPLDPREVDPATGRALEGAVVGCAVDAPHLLMGQVGELRRVRESGERKQAEDDVAVYVDSSS